MNSDFSDGKEGVFVAVTALAITPRHGGEGDRQQAHAIFSHSLAKERQVVDVTLGKCSCKFKLSRGFLRRRLYDDCRLIRLSATLRFASLRLASALGRANDLLLILSIIVTRK